MKKKILFFLALVCILNLVGCSSYINDEKDLIQTDTVENNYRDNSEIAEEVICLLQNELAFEDKDLLTFNNGTFESIDIKSTQTAEMLFQCIRNCVCIVDLTGANLKPMHYSIKMNGRELVPSTFDCLYIDYPETEQFLCIVFSEEDSTTLYEYVMALQTTN